MSDLISKTDLIEHLDECIAESEGNTPIVDGVLLAIKCAVEQMPTVDGVTASTGTENGGLTMSDWQRDKLVELLKADAEFVRKFSCGNAKKPEEITDYLLAHGVSVVPSKVREAEK